MNLLKKLITIVFVSTLSLSINAKEIKMGKADWDTGYFQAEVYKKALEKMGYKVTGPTVMKPQVFYVAAAAGDMDCLLYTSPSPRDGTSSRMPSSA